MKKISIIVSLFIIIVLSSFKCTKGTNYNYIENKSSIPIYYQVSFNYPDTTLVNEIRPPGGNFVGVNSKETDNGGSTYFVYNDTLQYFIFSADTIEQKTWEEVKANGSYLKRYTFSRQDLEMLNWTITYP